MDNFVWPSTETRRIKLPILPKEWVDRAMSDVPFEFYGGNRMNTTDQTIVEDYHHDVKEAACMFHRLGSEFNETENYDELMLDGINNRYLKPVFNILFEMTNRLSNEFSEYASGKQFSYQQHSDENQPNVIKDLRRISQIDLAYSDVATAESNIRLFAAHGIF